MSIFDVVSDWIHDLFGGTTSTDLADLGADPDQVVPAGGNVPDAPAAQFPTMGGSPAMEQVNESMAKATTAYNEGMEIADDAPKMPSAGEQAGQFIHGVMNASPEQLEHMGGTLGALEASGEISNEVDASHHALLDSKAEHAQRIAEDQALIHAKAVEQGAQAAIDRAKEG
jgi:hypothetical protein